mgnify:CR=1 FL=1
MIAELGYPTRTFFELFDGQHYSNKIYSVQVEDWKYYFEHIFERESNLTDKDGKPVKIRDYDSDLYFAVANTNTQHTLSSKADDVQVIPSEYLISYLVYKGIELPEELWVMPLAFNWEAGEVDIEEDIPEPEPEKKINSKTWLAIALAALSFLK